MAKTAKDKTPIQKAADAARARYTNARDANTKADNTTTQKTLAEAKTARDTAVKAESRERFVLIGGSRVGKAITALNNVGKLAAPRSYEYSEEDISIAEKLLSDAFKGAISALRAAKSAKGETAATGSIFS